jgi:hypothetical protein
MHLKLEHTNKFSKNYFFLFFVMQYLAKEGTRSCFDEGADFLDVGAGADVLEVWAVLHVVKVRTVSLAQKSWASSLGQLASRFGKEWASTSRLKMKIYETILSQFQHQEQKV